MRSGYYEQHRVMDYMNNWGFCELSPLDVMNS